MRKGRAPMVTPAGKPLTGPPGGGGGLDFGLSGKTVPFGNSFGTVGGPTSVGFAVGHPASVSGAGRSVIGRKTSK